MNVSLVVWGVRLASLSSIVSGHFSGIIFAVIVLYIVSRERGDCGGGGRGQQRRRGGIFTVFACTCFHVLDSVERKKKIGNISDSNSGKLGVNAIRARVHG